ncbi:MAG: hypothetical protein CMJ18_15130 [Phycisphaeraceae bacterium]|nr:hypothetical protein [Phycisphaeraceae bacterium]
MQEVFSDPAVSTQTIDYTYDAAGNRLTKAVDGAVSTYTYNDALELTGDGVSTYTYDANGNLRTRDDGTDLVTYDYDIQDQLIRVTTQTPSDTTVVVYVYSAGTRLERTIDGADVTRYLVDYAPLTENVLLEIDAAGDVEASYVYGIDLVSRDASAQSTYFHHDLPGSVRQVTDDAGLVVEDYAYDAFGNLRSVAGTTGNEFLYKGEQADPGSGLVYMRDRYYDPQTGRFIARDAADGQVDRPLTFNRYAFAEGNPVLHSDPTGMFSLLQATSVLMAQATISGIQAVAAFPAIQALFPPPITDDASQFKSFTGMWLQGTASVDISITVGATLDFSGQRTLSRAFGVPVVAHHNEVYARITMNPAALPAFSSQLGPVSGLDTSTLGTVGDKVRRVFFDISNGDLGSLSLDPATQTAILEGAIIRNGLALRAVGISAGVSLGTAVVHQAKKTTQLDGLAVGISAGGSISPFAGNGFAVGGDISYDIGIEANLSKPPPNGSITFPSISLSVSFGVDFPPGLGFIEFDTGMFAYIAERV